MKKTLTAQQENCIALMIAKGGGMTAAATRDAWEKGESYYIDARNPLRGKGVMRKFSAGNKEAVKPFVRPDPPKFPGMSQEDLLRLWFDDEPSARSPYVLKGNRPMWKTAEKDGWTLFTAPCRTMSKKESWMPYGETDGLMYQYQFDGKWTGQGVQTTFQNFSEEGSKFYQ